MGKLSLSPEMFSLAAQLRYNVRNNPQLAVGQLAAITAGVTVALVIGYCVYNLYFHPLRSYPGPKLWAMTRLPYTLSFRTGKGIFRIRELHQQYGPFVRLSPDIVSCSHPDAIHQLQGHRKGGKPENPKDDHVVLSFKDTIVGLKSREEHSRIRRVMSHGFSAQSMLEQQPIIKRYVDLLLERLRERGDGGRTPLDVCKWYNWTTFDIIGDLAFGESFGNLETGAYHPWVSIIFESLMVASLVTTLHRFELIGKLLPSLLIPRAMNKKMQEHTALSAMKVDKRLASDADRDRPDLIGKMVASSEKHGNPLTRHELVHNASALITAGSETTAALLCGATWLLAKHPPTLAKLQDEIRSSFTREDEIDLISTQNLKYLQACLDESLRYFPPAVGNLPRVIAPGGDTIIDRHVPEGTVLEVWQWVINHNPAYFHKPDEFHPERWLGDEGFKNDQLQGVNPFSVGPRNCIGKNLANSEMRLIIARIVWNFDFHLAPGSEDWYDRCLAYAVWQKPALNVHFVPREIKA